MAENLIQSILRRKVKRTQARLVGVRLFEAFALPAAVAFAVLAMVLSGAWAGFAPGAQAFLYIFFIPFFVITLVRGFLRLRLPTLEEARARLDQSHAEAPIAAFADHPARISSDSRPYWVRHKARLAGVIARMDVPSLTKEWKSADPLFLRFIMPAALITIGALNYTSATSRLGDATQTDIGALFGAQDMQITAWITPPDYTGVAPVFLNSVDRDYTVPEGSVLTLRIQGGGEPALRRDALNGDRLAGRRSPRLARSADGTWETEFAITSSQALSLEYWGERAAWNITAEEDEAPTVRFATDPALGSDDEVTFVWGAEDEYGVVSLNLVLRPTENSGLDTSATDFAPVEMPSANFTVGNDQAHIDLTRHKWAGAEVELVLEATDALGQIGLSEPFVMTLPQKLFLEPLARASQEIRLVVMREDELYSVPVEDMLPASEGASLGLGDRLENAPDGLQRAALMLDAVTFRPETYYTDLTVYLGFRRAHELLRFANETSDAAPLDDLLWSVALRAEYGTVADAERRLAAARQALERALRDGASEEEVRRLMQAFRNAAEDYIAARMAEAIMNGGPNGMPQDPGDTGNVLGGNDIADMLNALQDLTETGATDAARQLLSDVTDLLNNLNFQGGGSGAGDMFGAGENGEASDEPPPEEEQRLERTLERLAEILEEQRRLNDETLQEQFGSDPNEGNQGASGQQGSVDGQSGQGDDPNSTADGAETENGTGYTQSGEMSSGGAQEYDGPDVQLSDRQDDILGQLEAFTELEDTSDSFGTTDRADDNIDIARQALDYAEEALRNGDLQTAQRYQDRAIREMREAASQLSENLDELRRSRLGERGEGGSRDPLGRAGGGAQQNGGTGIEIPDEIDRQRARDILDELRDRLNRSTDPAERDYLERLLDRF